MSTDAAGLPGATPTYDPGVRTPGDAEAHGGTTDSRTDQSRTIIDSIPAMVWSARPDGTTEFVNRRCLEFAGLPADAVHEWDWTALVHPDDRDAVGDYWRSALRSGESGKIEVRMRGADGVYRWFLVWCSPARDASGAVVRWYGANTDIEDRRCAEDAVRASEQHLRTVLDTLPVLAIVLDAAGQIELVNRRVVEYTGKSFEELQDRPRGDALHPDDSAAANARWRRAFETGEPAEVTIRLRRADGVYRWFQSQSVPLRDVAGRVVRWASQFTDIEEMQRVTEALQASEQRLREVIDGIPTFLYTMAPGGEPEFFNRPFLEYLGRTGEEMMDWARVGVIHPDDLARSMAVWARAVATGQDYALEFRLRRADGVFRWFELRSRTVRDAGGRIVRSYGVVADIDDRKRAERRLRRAMRARHEAVLAERTRLARDMHDGLLQDLSGLALQLGAALPRVRTAPDAAEEQLARVLDEAQRVNRAARDAVLEMRAEAGAADLVSAVHAEAQRLATQGGLALSVHVRGPARLVSPAVRDAAVGIVHEALTNVLKHARARGVRVSIAFGGTRLRVVVRDDGGGMTPASDPAAMTAQFGLVGMRERAASIGAALRISSAPGRGTSVGLEVSLTSEQATQTAHIAR